MSALERVTARVFDLTLENLPPPFRPSRHAHYLTLSVGTIPPILSITERLSRASGATLTLIRRGNSRRHNITLNLSS